MPLPAAGWNALISILVITSLQSTSLTIISFVLSLCSTSSKGSKEYLFLLWKRITACYATIRYSFQYISLPPWDTVSFFNTISPLLAVWMDNLSPLFTDNWINKSIETSSSLLIRTPAQQQATATMHTNQLIIDLNVMDIRTPFPNMSLFYWQPRYCGLMYDALCIVYQHSKSVNKSRW